MFLITIIYVSLSAQTAIAPAVGDGTVDNPYEIYSLENLYWISASDDVVPSPDQKIRWSSHYIQTTDIEASSTSTWFNGQGWSPIGYFISGYDNQLFMGSYDGQDHTIDALFVRRIYGGHIGLFGKTYGATIENLGLTNIFIRGDFSVGGIVGELASSTIRNCYSTGSVNGRVFVGGLVGYTTDNSTIKNCYSEVIITNGHYLGGLVGSHGNSTIINCYSTGSVFADSYGLAGGLVGSQYLSTIINSYSTANVSSIGSFIGGLIGDQLWSTVSNSYSTGSVSGHTRVGGLMGRNYRGAVIHCYSFGSVTGSSHVGGLVGFIDSDTGYQDTNNYWNIETSCQTSSVMGNGRTTAEMTYPYDSNTFVSWDFEEIWAEDLAYEINNGYPYLRDVTVPVSVDEELLIVPEAITLCNYPNPFNPETTIEFYLPDRNIVKLHIYNIRGQKIASLVNQQLDPGKHAVSWNGCDDRGKEMPSGVYFCRLTTGQQTFTRKMMLLK